MIDMNLTNDSYLILIGTRNFTERYYRDKKGWLKVSARGRRFRMTAEQVLNHILPALAGIKPNVTIDVEHHELPVQNEQSAQQHTADGSQLFSSVCIRRSVSAGSLR
jgi:hypothetical protein